MQIYFERHGGFAGMRFETALDTDELPPEKAGPLKELIDGANFFNLPQSLIAAPPQPDRFHYRLTITDGKRSHTVEMSASNIPENLQPLVQELDTIAKNQRRF